MTYWKLGLGLSVMLAWGVGVSAASAQQLNPQQIQLIKDTAISICNTVKEAKGEKTDVQIQGEITLALQGKAVIYIAGSTTTLKVLQSFIHID